MDPKQTGLNRARKFHQLHFIFLGPLDTEKLMYLYISELTAGLQTSKADVKRVAIMDNMTYADQFISQKAACFRQNNRNREVKVLLTKVLSE